MIMIQTLVMAVGCSQCL